MTSAKPVANTHTAYLSQSSSAIQCRTPLLIGPRVESIAQLGFVLLWACVMPFICWGAWAQPGHSHPSPHPFFSSAVPSVEHIGHTAATPDQAKDEQPAGASRPDTLLASLFLLGLLLRQSWLPRLQAERRYTRRRTLHTRQAWLPVPTPPPRQV